MEKWEASEIIEKQLCKEMMQIAEQIQKNQSMSIQDLEKLDKIYHTLKSKETYEAMVEAGDYMEERGMSGDNQNGMSGRRGRAANGRFVSRMSGNSYDEGYRRGYSEAMNHMPYYDEPRRW